MRDLEKQKNLELIFKTLKRDVDPVIKELLFLNVDPEFRELLEYQISTGGKRLRPALAIAGCLLLGGKLEDVLYPAAGLEILHNYSLIVDDIIDHSDIRRGKLTTWRKFGQTIAQCVAIDYSGTVLQAASRSSQPKAVSEIFARTIKFLTEGEILDILFEQSGREKDSYITQHRYLEISEGDYLKMVSRKTASLFQTCCEIGGICAQAEEKQIKALKNYGFNLGLAFQIRDDILDIFGEEEKFGKEIGKDIKENKGGNIVFIFALQGLGSQGKERVLEAIKKKDNSRADVQEVIKLIKGTKAHAKAYAMGERFVQKARKNLETLPQNQWNDFLKEITDFVMEREK